jgi:SAM-dependent methyltransferase
MTLFPEDTGYEKCAHLYDLFDAEENIRLFLHYGCEAGEILDVGAGTGRIAIPLAEKGVRVFCVEPSPAMREQFEKKLKDRPELAENIQLVSGNASSFSFRRTFPAAMLSGCFDHFLDDDERLSSLLNIGRHLNHGGKLVFDVGLGYMKDSPLSSAGSLMHGSKEYRRFVGSRLLPNETMEWLLVFEIYQSGKLVDRIEQTSWAGVIDRPKLHGLLKRAGFEVAREFGDYDFKTFEEGDKILVIEAVKEGKH